ncbi:MAG: YlxM family DNA-binding protein [Candidatus Desulforudis sp.]|nr:YlxM family DNA-binding protein [Desulforudis sp.]
MDKFAWINLLYDFYGPLLTARQQRLLELYYEQDLSLGEIAGELRVSRQAVHDTVKRAEESLERLELKLGLAHKHLADKSRVGKALAKRRSAVRRRRPEPESP